MSRFPTAEALLDFWRCPYSTRYLTFAARLLRRVERVLGVEVLA